jgi:uncharacterized protein (DUF433 family)
MVTGKLLAGRGQDASSDAASPRGAYKTARAAELSGVPYSVLKEWARDGLYPPSVSAEPRHRLWSWTDLLGLRAVDWLRCRKSYPSLDAEAVGHLQHVLADLDVGDLSADRAHRPFAVVRDGELEVTLHPNPAPDRHGQPDSEREALDLVAPYRAGTDLLQPHPLLRIIPGKLHGEPHLVHTRIPTAAVYALHEQGYSLAEIQQMYPEAAREALQAAIDFERALHARAA